MGKQDNIPEPDLRKVNDNLWEISTDYKEGMRVPARIVGNKEIIEGMDMGVYDQITNVATLPGIQNPAYCMSDGHWGYGFPIGGVAAFDPEEGGVISPGGIGFDINCGMRLVRTNLTYDEVKPKIKDLIDQLFDRVPSGVGSSGFINLRPPEFKDSIELGAEWAVEQGYGWEEDLERTEEQGRMEGADSSKVSDKAIKRGLNQIGTLGSGNHYLEIQRVKEENILDEELAEEWGIFPDQIVVMFHCGSRGFGHQVGTDYLQSFLDVMESKYDIKIRDRELACAPFNSEEGQDYFKAMQCGVNMSFANRQVILHRVREVFSDIFGEDAESLGMHQVYDVAHNTAKKEKYKIDGKTKELIVHRKGATRSFGPGREELPDRYQNTGQPVIIGGSMQTGSYLLAGTKEAEEKTFGSTAHGAGRTMSRKEAKNTWWGETLQEEMEENNIYVRTSSHAGLAEEAGGAYKDVDSVIESTSKMGLSKPVARFIPIGNVKG